MEDEYNDLEDYEQEETVELNEVIDALLDEDATFPPRYLYRLSGLEGPDLEQFTEIWPQVTQTRRERLLEDLETLADRTTYLDFDEVFTLGLAETSAHARQLSLRGLWESENPNVASEMLDLLTLDPDTDVRTQAARSLGKFVYLGELQELNSELFNRITDELIQVFSQESPENIRRGALEALGFCSRVEVRSLIEASYDEDREYWLISTLIAMGRSADEQWLPQVIESLNHDSPEVRLEAAQAAGLLAAQSAVTHLLYLIDDPEEDVKKAAIWSLSEIGGLDARAALEGLLKSTTDDEEIEFLEEALENLDFTELSINFDLLDLSEEDLDEMIEDQPDQPEE